MQPIIRFLDLIATRASALLACLAGIMLVAMMLLACSNMVIRAFATSIKGTVEMVGFCGAMLTAFSLGYAQIKKGHIAVGLLAKLFPVRLRSLMDALQHFASAIFFAWAAIETFRWGISLIDSDELSETLRIIYHPFVFCAALGCVVISFVLFVDALKTLFPARIEQGEVGE